MDIIKLDIILNSVSLELFGSWKKNVLKKNPNLKIRSLSISEVRNDISLALSEIEKYWKREEANFAFEEINDIDNLKKYKVMLIVIAIKGFINSYWYAKLLKDKIRIRKGESFFSEEDIEEIFGFNNLFFIVDNFEKK